MELSQDNFAHPGRTVYFAPLLGTMTISYKFRSAIGRGDEFTGL